MPRGIIKFYDAFISLYKYRIKFARVRKIIRVFAHIIVIGASTASDGKSTSLCSPERGKRSLSNRERNLIHRSVAVDIACSMCL